MSHRVPILSSLCLVFSLLLLWQSGSPDTSAIEYRLPPLSEIASIEVTRTNRVPVSLNFLDGHLVIGERQSAGDLVAQKQLSKAFENSIGMDLSIGRNARADRYGLSEHSITVSIRSKTSQIAHFRLGKVIDNQRTFIEDVGTGNIYRAQADLREVFDRPIFTWRERRLFPQHDYKDIRSIQMNHKGNAAWKVSRDNSKSHWKAVSPDTVEVGQREVDAIANTLASAQAISLVQDDIFVPTRTLHATTFDGTNLILKLGLSRKDGSVQVRTQRGDLVLLPRHQNIFLQATLDDLRNRRIFDHSSEQVRAVSLAGADSVQLTFNEGWFLVSPGPRTLLKRQVSDSFLEALTSLKGSGFGSVEAFGTVAFSVTLRLEDNSIEVLELGAPFGKGRYARRRSKPNRVLVLPASAIRLLEVTRSELIKTPN
jgi:hypothetical protein